jgi:hypothetical protein
MRLQVFQLYRLCLNYLAASALTVRAGAMVCFIRTAVAGQDAAFALASLARHDAFVAHDLLFRSV